MRVERLQNLLARLHALPRRRLTLLVAVDGLAASGKTTLTRALVALDPGLDVIEMTDFVLAGADRLEGGGEEFVERQGGAGGPGSPARRPEGGSPPSEQGARVDWRRLRNTVFLPLTRDQAARYQRRDAATGAMAEWRTVPVGGIVIVEGRYSCVRALASFYDFRVWVECPLDIRRRRLAGADGMTSPKQQFWLQADRLYVDAQDPAAAAHLRVDGSGLTAHDPAAEYVRLLRRGS